MDQPQPRNAPGFHAGRIIASMPVNGESAKRPADAQPRRPPHSLSEVPIPASRRSPLDLQMRSCLECVRDFRMSVPGHALRCGPETSVTSPLRWRWFELRGHERHISSRRGRGNLGIPNGISKECGKGEKPASWLSMLSILCHFHGLLFARQCWIRLRHQRNAPHRQRNA